MKKLAAELLLVTAIAGSSAACGTGNAAPTPPEAATAAGTSTVNAETLRTQNLINERVTHIGKTIVGNEAAIINYSVSQEKVANSKLDIRVKDSPVVGGGTGHDYTVYSASADKTILNDIFVTETKNGSITGVHVTSNVDVSKKDSTGKVIEDANGAPQIDNKLSSFGEYDAYKVDSTWLTSTIPTLPNGNNYAQAATTLEKIADVTAVLQTPTFQ